MAEHVGKLALVLVLFAGAAMAGEAVQSVQITLPDSDVVTTAKPFVVSIVMPEALAAAKPPVATVELRRAEPGLEKATALVRSVQLAPVKAEGGASCAVAIDASKLAEGEYAGTLTVTAGEARQSAAFTMFSMPEGRPKEFPYGNYSIYLRSKLDPATGKTVPDRDHQRLVLRGMRVAGMNLLCQHMNGMENYNWLMDQAARQGIWFMPSSNVLGHDLPLNEEVATVPSDGKPMEGWLRYCMFTPKVREKSVERFTAAVRGFLTHPAFSGKIYYGDDLSMPSKRADGKVILTCYCARCKEAFKQRTGSEPPTSSEPIAGVVPANNVFLQWMRFRCGDVYGGYLREMEKTKNAVDPALAMGPIHGYSEQPFTNVISGIYSPLQQTTTAVSSYVYPNLRSPRMDLISEFEIGRMGNRGKDVWMLGQVAMDAVCPPWRIYQNYWNMTAAGYRFITYFSLGGFDLVNWEAQIKGKWMPDMTEADWTNVRRHIDWANEALIRCANHKDWILPTAGLWAVSDTRNALLYSFTTEASDIWPEDRGKKHLEEITLFYRESLRQHVPMKIVCEEEIRTGMLNQLDALCLYDVRALPDDVARALEAWAAKGGRLYVHNEAGLKPKGAKAMSMETMIALVGDNTPFPRLDNRDITVRELRSGDARYYVFINNYTDRYWGLVHYYGKPGANYADLELVRNEPAATTVRFPEKDRYLFDMNTGEPAGSTNEPLRLALEPSWGRALIALPAKSAKLSVSGPDALKQGEEAKYAIEVLDGAGKRVNGAFTVKADITAPSGRKSRYTCPLGVAGGAGELRLPIGANDETGKWTVTFEGGFPRATVTRTLKVTEGTAIAGILTARDAVRVEKK